MDNVSDFSPLTCLFNLQGLQRDGMKHSLSFAILIQKSFCPLLDTVLLTSYQPKGIIAYFIFQAAARISLVGGNWS